MSIEPRDFVSSWIGACFTLLIAALALRDPNLGLSLAGVVFFGIVIIAGCHSNEH